MAIQPKVYVHVGLTPEQHARALELCRIMGVTVTDYIRHAVDDRNAAVGLRVDRQRARVIESGEQ